MRRPASGAMVSASCPDFPNDATSHELRSAGPKDVVVNAEPGTNAPSWTEASREATISARPVAAGRHTSSKDAEKPNCVGS